MGLKNFYELNTIYGYKSIELHHDNLVSFSRPVDCLVISAYKGSYVPVRGSLIHALHEEGVEIKTL